MRRFALAFSLCALCGLGGLGACSSGESPDAGGDLGPGPDLGGDAGSPGDAGSGTDAGSGSLDDALMSMGFDVQHGALAFPTLDCCAAATCFGNNPSSPYGELFVPRGPGQTVANPGERADGTSPTWRLREDEAIVYVGPTPPHVGYFGFTPYLFDRASGTTAARDTVFASLSDTLNDDVIHTAGGAGAPFAVQTVIVVTANATTLAMVHASLAAAGIADVQVNDMPLPTAVLHLGLDASADTAAVLVRVAVFDDEAEKAAYLAAPGGSVYRVTPHVAFPTAPLTVPADRVRGDGTSESAREADVDALHDAIVAAHPGVPNADLASTDATPDPAMCISAGHGCNGDNRDALYTALTPLRLMADDQLVIYGVNHEASGKATYSNFAVYDLMKLYGVASVDSRSFPGSAGDYLHDARADGLFAWTIARHCPSGSTHCTEIPDGCPGVPIAQFMAIASRAYLEPSTHTGPVASELLLDRAILFRP